MKRTGYIFVALLLTAACAKKGNDPEFVPDTTFHRSGEVTLLASMENCSTKAAMSFSGEARWEKGDQIAVSCTDGSLAVLTLDGTGGTRKAFFKGEIPAGKQLGDYAFYPASAIRSFSGTQVSAILPESIGKGGCSLMAARIGGTYEIGFVQLLSYVTVKVGNIPSGAVSLEVSADKALSGSVSFDVEEAMEKGIPAQEGTSKLVATLGDGQTSVTYSMAVPVAEYASLHVSSLDSEGTVLTEGELLTASALLARSGQRSVELELPDYQEVVPEVPGAVYVCGTYWAKGNLLHKKGDTAEGFRTDWRLAPHQWYYVNCENTNSTDVTFSATSYDEYDHFNFGGIEDPFSNDAAKCINAAVGTNISGKMYLDQTCTSETTDFDTAKYGDIAWWASNGAWRMPTQNEIQNLLDKASVQYGNYVTPENKTLRGFLFTNPVSGQERVVNMDLADLTDEDLSKGVFFVKSGRRYDKQPFTVNKQVDQGTYWSSVVITHDKATKGLCYPAMLYLSTKTSFPHENAAFGSRAGFCIKPVYAKQP